MPRTRKTDDEVETTTDNPILEPVGDDAEDALDAVPADEDEDDVDFEDVPATAAGKASAARLVDLLVEKKVLQLHAKKAGAKLIEAVARVLESPLPVKLKSSKLTDVIVDSDDVDELFIDDDTMIELIKRW